MIHTALLVANREEYKNYSLETRKKIFTALYTFIKRADIRFFTIIIDKRYTDSTSVLKNKIKNEITKMLDNNKEFYNKFDKTIIYYDGGQAPLDKIINTIFPSKINNLEIIQDFDKVKEKLFQAADFFTFLDKYSYKLNNKMILTNNEKHFMNSYKIDKIIKSISFKKL